LVCILAALHALTLDHVKELYEVHGDFYNTTVLFWLFIFSIKKKNVGCHVLFSSIIEGVIQNFSTISYGVLLHGSVDVGCP
jgi:hypothetical protein